MRKLILIALIMTSNTLLASGLITGQSMALNISTPCHEQVAPDEFETLLESARKNMRKKAEEKCKDSFVILSQEMASELSCSRYTVFDAIAKSAFILKVTSSFTCTFPHHGLN